MSNDQSRKPLGRRSISTVEYGAEKWPEHVRSRGVMRAASMTADSDPSLRTVELDSPDGSVELQGLFSTYAKRLSDCALVATPLRPKGCLVEARALRTSVGMRNSSV